MAWLGQLNHPHGFERERGRPIERRTLQDWDKEGPQTNQLAANQPSPEGPSKPHGLVGPPGRSLVLVDGGGEQGRDGCVDGGWVDGLGESLTSA